MLFVVFGLFLVWFVISDVLFFMFGFVRGLGLLVHLGVGHEVVVLLLVGGLRGLGVGLEARKVLFEVFSFMFIIVLLCQYVLFMFF